MSRWVAAIFAHGVLSAAATAQEAYGPAEAAASDPEGELPPSAANQCETEAQEDGVILVCRELTDSERYMSPLPKPTASDRRMIPGLTDPPCWVQPRAGGGVCIRLGWAPEPAIMVDVTAFPEDLTEEEAEHVVAIISDGGEEFPALTGERVPIDLSND